MSIFKETTMQNIEITPEDVKEMQIQDILENLTLSDARITNFDSIYMTSKVFAIQQALKDNFGIDVSEKASEIFNRRLADNLNRGRKDND